MPKKIIMEINFTRKEALNTITYLQSVFGITSKEITHHYIKRYYPKSKPSGNVPNE